MKSKLEKKILDLQAGRARCIERANHHLATMDSIGEIRSESDIECACVSLVEMQKLLDKIGKIRFAEFEVDQILREIEG